MIDTPSDGTVSGNVVIVVMPDGNCTDVIVGAVEVFVVADTLTVKLLLG